MEERRVGGGEEMGKVGRWGEGGGGGGRKVGRGGRWGDSSGT